MISINNKNKSNIKIIFIFYLDFSLIALYVINKSVPFLLKKKKVVPYSKISLTYFLFFFF